MWENNRRYIWTETYVYSANYVSPFPADHGTVHVQYVTNSEQSYKLCHGEMSGYWLKFFLIKPEHYNKKFNRSGDPDQDSGFLDDNKK
jgi:hypothetical protein